MFGSIIGGVFEGKIIASDKAFYVEKAHHYFPHHKYPNKTFHSVIYDENHVEDPHEDKRKEGQLTTILDDIYRLSGLSRKIFAITR